MINNNGGSQRLRLSPNEEQALIKQEREKWRKFRLLQVREKCREESARILNKCKAKNKEATQEIRAQVSEKWQEEQQRQIHELEQQYDQCIRSIGAAHVQAKRYEDADVLKARENKINRQKAVARGNEALFLETKLQQDKQNKDLNKIRPILKSRHIEKCRAHKVSSLPLPPSLQPSKSPPKKERPKVTTYEAGNFCTSLFKPDFTPVRRETKPIIDPREAARIEEEKLNEMIAKQEAQKKSEDRLILERGKQALLKQQQQERHKLLLQDMEMADQRHQLSAYLQGADRTKLDDYDTTLNVDAANLAVKKILDEHNKNISSTSSSSSLGEEYTDLREIDEVCQDSTTEDSSLDILESQADKEKFIHALKEIKRLRQQQNRVEQQPTVVTSRQQLPPMEPHFRKDQQSTLVSPREQCSGVEQQSANITPGQQDQYDKHSSQVDFRPSQHDEVPYSSENSTSYQYSDNVTSCSDSTTLSSAHDDIHFKETVPVHKLRQNVNTLSSRKHSHIDFDSDLEELIIKCRIHSSNLSNVTVSMQSNFETSTPIQFNQTQRHSSDRESSTSYYSLPSTIYEDLQRIKENRERINSIIYNSPSDDDACVDRELLPTQERKSSLRNTSRYYTTPVKGDGSGEKPMRKKDKFEKIKKELIHHYLQKVLATEKGRIKEMSVSSVEGSGLTLSSGFLASDLEQTSESPSSKTPLNSGSSMTLDSTAIKEYCELDQVPVKIRSKQDEVNTLSNNNTATSDHLSKSTALPSFHSHSSFAAGDYTADISSSPSIAAVDADQMLQKKIQLTQELLKQLEKKKHILRLQQDELEISPSSTTSRNHYNQLELFRKQDPVNKFVKEHSNSEQSTLEETSRSITISTSTTSTTDSNTSTISSSLNNFINNFKTTTESGTCPDDNVNNNSNNRQSSTTPSTTTSLPDMTEVLSKFGIGTWAQSMNRRMDQADKVSSDTS